jgi:hypothetical protein
MLFCCLPTALNAQLQSLSCSISSMYGSGTDACTVTLNSAAPSSGLYVNLSSDNTAVTVPSTVTVAGHATSANFTATVSSVSTAQTVTLEASDGTVSKRFSLILGTATPMTTLTIAASSSSSTYGNAVTFTATISSGPTGTVTFYDGGAAIGTGTISGTTAMFTTSSMTAGSHTITASWPGNSSYSAVKSNAITQMVNKATPTINWSTPAAIPYGTALSSSQLDANSTTPGKFVYSPAAATVLSAGSQTLSVTFTPTDTTDYASTTKTVTLTVTQGASTLSIDATSVAFGDVAINTTATQSVTLTSTGTTSVTVSSATLTGTGFTRSGVTFPVTLASGQTATLYLQFDPSTATAVTGQLTIISNSKTNSTVAISLSGTGTSASHEVNLSWDAPTSSTDPVVGYNVYRATNGSSTYALLNSSVNTATAYVDSTVQSGLTYDYTVKSVDASSIESAPSEMIAVAIP